MKKIITAINNPELNNKLKKENDFKIIGKDLQYREAILELLDKNKNIDLIIISEDILGEINFEKLIEKIKFINEKIKIIFILKKENINLNKILKKNKIKIIYYEKNDNLFELIKNNINKKENINLKIINKAKKNNYKIENRLFIKNNKKKLNYNLSDFQISKKKKTRKNKNNFNNLNKKNEIMLNKIITFSGNQKSGKTTLSLIISQYLSNLNFKVLLIDGDLEKQDLSFILKSEFRVNKLKNNINKTKKFLYNTQEKCNQYKSKKLKNNILNIIKMKHDFKNKYFNFNNLKNNLKKNKIKSKINLNNLKKIKIKNKINLNNLKNKKRKIKRYKNNNYKIKKLNNNFYFLVGLNKILKKKEFKNKKMVQEKIIDSINIMKKEFDYIIIDVSKGNFNYFNKKILEISNKNFIVMELNLLGIKEIGRLLNLYLNIWNINKNSLHIIANKTNMFSVNLKLFHKIISIKNDIYKIEENKKYSILINNYFKRNILLKNKKIKKEINKIIKIINK